MCTLTSVTKRSQDWSSAVSANGNICTALICMELLCMTDMGQDVCKAVNMVIITQCVQTSVFEIGMDVWSTVSTGGDNNSMCVD